MAYKDKRKQREWYLRNKDRIIQKSNQRYKQLKQTNEGRKKLKDWNEKARKKYKESGKPKKYTRKRWKELKSNPEEYKKHREKQKKYWKKWIKKPISKEKYQLRQYAYWNLRNNIIRERKMCEKCGSKEKLELHHQKYTKNQKDITLLCRSCHLGEHYGI